MISIPDLNSQLSRRMAELQSRLATCNINRYELISMRMAILDFGSEPRQA